MSKKNRAGMVLFVTLIISAVIAMFLAAAVQLLPTTGLSANNLKYKEQAALAAQSGLDYARSRLQEDPAWRGEGTGLVVNSSNLQVIEDNGNVFGIITDGDGQKSLFRFRFNFQNGNANPDEELTDPSQLIDSEFVSFNNLRSASGQDQYRAIPNGGTWSVTNASPIPVTLPRFTAAIIVEGFAGPALRTVSPTSLTVDPSQGVYNRQVTEAYFVRPGFLTVDSAVMAASKLDGMMLNNGAMTVESAEAGNPPRVRALNNIDVFSDSGSANYQTTPNGEVIVDTSGDFRLNGTTSSNPAPDKESATEQGSHWLKLDYDQVTKATTSDAQAKAGTYVWKAGAGGPRLEYFPVEYTGTVPAGTGAIISSESTMLSSGSNAIDITPTNFRLRIKNNVYIAPQVSGSVTGFSVVAEPGLMSATGIRPELLMNNTIPEEGVIMSNDSGPIYIEGKIDGGGAVTAGGDITFQGTSSLEADPEMAVALYSKGDINLKAIPTEIVTALSPPPVPPRVRPGRRLGKGGRGRGRNGGNPPPATGITVNPFGLAQDVAFGGILYAQGNFNVDLREQNQAGLLGGTQHGSLFVKGILATFGGDPAIQTLPGQTPGKGIVDLKVAKANFVYDPDYLEALQDLDSPGRLEKSFWTTH